jgi:hypothetical protein
MDISAWLKSLEDTGFATGVRHSLYLFPFLESVHVMALSVVFGTVMVVDLRMLGLASIRRPFTRMATELLKITWGAFAVAALTGAMMFMTNARVYAANTSFRVKMLLLVLAAINMAVFHLTAGKPEAVRRWDTAPSGPGPAKAAGALSLILWVAIIVAGRVIGFTTTGKEAKEAPPPAQNFDDFLSGAPGDSAPVPAPAATPQSDSTANAKTSDLTIKIIMDTMVDPSGDFLFESVADISDDRGVTHKAPRTAQEWDAVRHHLQVLIDAQPLLIAPGRRAANPTDRSANPAVENQPEEVQKLLDAQHADFVQRADRLRQAAASGLKAVDAQDKDALLVSITAIDKACESCHLHYWYPKDKRAHQAAKEEGGIIE